MSSTDEPTIYYLGNKLRSAEAIDHHCALRFGSHASVLDAFAGSGSVSREFSRNRHVIANDTQTYSMVICRALLVPEASSARSVREIVGSGRFNRYMNDLKDAYVDAIDAERCLTRGSSSSDLVNYQDRVRELRNSNQFSVPRSYGGLYFSVEQACELEALRQTAVALDGPVRFHFLAALISAASRLAFTVGNQFAQPMHWFKGDGSVKDTTLIKFIQKRRISALATFLRCIDIYSGLKTYSNENKSVEGTAEKAIIDFGNKVDFVYLDPPYGREHYSRYYHVLETFARLDRPIIENQQTMMREGRFQSKYSIRTQAEAAFRSLFSAAKAINRPIALSYADDSAGDRVANRIMSVVRIVELASECYANIETIHVHNRSYAQMNSGTLSSKRRANTEVLIVARD